MKSSPPFQISHFSINADDVDRALNFYSAIFGWKFTAWGPPGFYLIDTGGIVHGALQQRQQALEGKGIRGCARSRYMTWTKRSGKSSI
jgi:uncharacterized protein